MPVSLSFDARTLSIRVVEAHGSGPALRRYMLLKAVSIHGADTACTDLPVCTVGESESLIQMFKSPDFLGLIIGHWSLSHRHTRERMRHKALSPIPPETR